MAARDVTERSPRRTDVGALVGLLATLEGELMARDSGDDEIPEWAHHLARRLSSDGLLAAEAGKAQSRSGEWVSFFSQPPAR